MKYQQKRPAIIEATLDYISPHGENFNVEHQFAYQVSGTLKIIDGQTTNIFSEGGFRFIARNHIGRFFKESQKNSEFRSISVAFDKELLKEMAEEYGFVSNKKYDKSLHVIKLKPEEYYISFFNSLKSFLPVSDDNDPLVKIKQKEAVLMLIKFCPELTDILFDFDEPGKIPLAPFMEQNYCYNLKLLRFAYLTGRSLSAFKRDFEKEFHTTPGKWIHNKRLDQAYYLIKEKGIAPSNAYIEVGFEDLSHFSDAFKKRFSISPSHLFL
ncbi:MAG: AraC family transcriptional regulator [Bacteroidales bacterium]|jgi:AraC-like DNA-binding protein|nr:AraC family transcriptional regulator [Bacteroidales bacterium]